MQESKDSLSLCLKKMLEAIILSKGRVMVTEVIGAVHPVLFNISNAESACALGFYISSSA